MEGLWLASYVALWIVVVVEGLVIIALARQIGLLYEHIPPSGARMMNAGPGVGDEAPPLQTTDVLGHSVTLGASRGKRTLLVFISPRCSTCKALLPSLKALHRSEKNNLEVVLIASEAMPESIRKLIDEHRLYPMPVILSDELSELYQIGVIPYAILIDRHGIVRAKGLVNTMAHLESLLNAEELGHPSIEKLLEAQGILSKDLDQVHEA